MLEVKEGEQFFRYTDDPTSTGRFLTQTAFDSSENAVESLGLEGWNNSARYVQEVLAEEDSLVLTGEIEGGLRGILQYLVLDTDAFGYGTGVEVDGG